MRKQLASVFGGIARSLRAVLGAPDYERYIGHVQTCHPGRVPMSREAFERERLAARYSRTGSRCC
jgi:uncharacterized short protein YbdD (DUF466 family)